MALIYTKLTDKTTVLAPREGACRKFNFGTDWTEMRMGAFLVAVAASGSNVDNVAETLVPAGITDHVTFGIKDDSQTLPGQLGSLFIGIRDGDAANVQSSVLSGIGGSGGNWRTATYVDTTETIGSSVAAGGRLGVATASAASAYNQFFGLRLVINNLGLSTQSVTIYTALTNNVTGTDYSATALRTRLNNDFASGSLIGTIAWNTGVVARTIPNCFWIRTPLYLNSLRISCIRAIRYAP